MMLLVELNDEKVASAKKKSAKIGQNDYKPYLLGSVIPELSQYKGVHRVLLQDYLPYSRTHCTLLFLKNFESESRLMNWRAIG